MKLSVITIILLACAALFVYGWTQRMPGEALPLLPALGEAAPVCAQPPMPPCDADMACAAVLPPAQEFGSREDAEVVGADVLHDGPCVCGDNGIPCEQ